VNEETLPPSPNWHLSNVLACTADDTIPYGAKNNIVIAKYLPGYSANVTPQICVIRNAHNERVTVVASPQAEKIVICIGTAWHLLVMSL
jgi:hypothetical protein